MLNIIGLIVCLVLLLIISEGVKFLSSRITESCSIKIDLLFFAFFIFILIDAGFMIHFANQIRYWL